MSLSSKWRGLPAGARDAIYCVVFAALTVGFVLSRTGCADL